mmetsp:Transcript_41916/g.99487  ORF Transcript_41916/g.99487 Transcript_41916/m.99487 type:complete len:349 (-) Transcript_41916:63-1109(-)|eukprot:CAMPEP_0180163874 /NCGR_PEP_ID=MMETSP0986-20121125/30052_1 /TAXON_ID=697907 /ORGANISM="non described non described, Strain CCMP2293" /LENGTH=348 /DNA_ID=CAMNT_0022114579 /DNA_START=109 /DNA_END=1155 /DNA_ORIENTATION=+
MAVSKSKPSVLQQYRGLLLAAFLLGFFGYVQYSGFDAVGEMKKGMLSYKDQLNSAGWKGALAVVVVDVVFIVCVFPGSFLLELFCGYVFGVPAGVAVILTAKNCAAVLCYFIGKTIMADTVRGWLKDSPTFQAMQKTNQASGWQLVLAMRLSPMPSYMVSYGSSVINVPFGAYMAATATASIPMVVQNVYMGSLVTSVEDLFSPNKATGVGSDMLQLALPFLGTIGIVVWTKQFLSAKSAAPAGKALGSPKAKTPVKTSAAAKTPTASPLASPLASPRAPRGKSPSVKKTPAKSKTPAPAKKTPRGKSPAPSREKSPAPARGKSPAAKRGGSKPRSASPARTRTRSRA